MRTPAVLVTVLFALLFTAGATTPTAFDAFSGKWMGFLEYQDYSGPGRVKIPVKLNVTAKTATTAIWDFVYDDFGRNVPSYETHTWNGTDYSVITKGQSEVQRYTSADFAALIARGSGKAVLLGQELEVGRTVEVRRTITLTGAKLTTLKETRPKGGAFSFRNQSTYTRSR